MQFEIPDEVLEKGAALHELAESTALPSTQRKANTAFQDYADIFFLKAVLKFTAERYEQEQIDTARTLGEGE